MSALGCGYGVLGLSLGCRLESFLLKGPCFENVDCRDADVWGIILLALAHELEKLLWRKSQTAVIQPPGPGTRGT